MLSLATSIPARWFRPHYFYYLVIGSALTVAIVGCRSSRFHDPGQIPAGTKLSMLEIKDPVICADDTDPVQFYSETPITVRNWKETEKLPMTLDEVIAQALQSSQILQRLGGTVVAAPQAVATTYDPTLLATDARLSSEAALAAFDGLMTAQAQVTHRETGNPFQTAFGGGNIQKGGSFNYGFSKIAATGSEFSFRTVSNYSRSPNLIINPADPFGLAFWETSSIFEMRQPLLRNFGTGINRVAGPNAVPGQYNGVLIARIREDVSVADFELAIRDLVRDTEAAYWELYFAYRDVDAKIRAREAAREAWEKQNARVAGDFSRKDEEAIARQQYYSFQLQVELAISGRGLGTPGLLGSERNLRRILNLPNSDGRLILPTTTPTIAPVALDWNSSQQVALEERVEVRRQKWIVKQRELEYWAACQLNKWQLDLVGNYNFGGFGRDWLGNNGAVNDMLFQGDLDSWQFGFEFANPLGRRVAHLAVRNAQLQLARDKAVLREQQRQVLLDLNQAYTEVDRAFAAIKSNYNNRLAVLEELEPKRARYEAGLENIFFLLDVQQRAANAETLMQRSVVDYNISLLDYALESGTLLEQYNVFLAEAPWDAEAQADAAENGRQFGSPILGRNRDGEPLTQAGQ